MMGSGTECTVRQVSSEWLRIGRRLLYVEPWMAEANARGDVFLAGRYNYLGELDSVGHWHPIGQDGDILGAYLPHDGPPRIVASPFPEIRVGTIRAVPDGPRSWFVVFVEAVQKPNGLPSDSAKALWSGRYDGSRWSQLERLPVPSGAVFWSEQGASLVRRADTLIWAVVKKPGYGLLMFQRQANRWTFTENRVFLADADVHSGEELVLGVVQADPAIAEGDGNSLLLWTRRPTWQILHTVVPGRRERVYRPSIREYRNRSIITWQTPNQTDDRGGWEMHAMVAADPSVESPVFIVDSVNSGSRPETPVFMADGRPLWITDHRGPDGIAQIQFAVYDPATGSSEVRARFANPFVTPFMPVVLPDRDVLISGAHYENQSYVVSVLQRYRLRCAERTAARSPGLTPIPGIRHP
ncbi:MAG: hypothetical protein JWM27_1507 [Gemmatimonadetes bacterium]|nr:hypothetical protein [Gemmatimonadota bacterium]